MKADIAKKWVKALRKPGIKQTKGRLFDGIGYCCLGVLCVVLGKKFKQKKDGNFAVVGTQAFAGLPPSIVKLAGMNENGNGLGNRKDGDEIFGHPHLGCANDGDVSFKRIATWIEKNYEKL
jgi:hypothetical protein